MYQINQNIIHLEGCWLHILYEGFVVEQVTEDRFLIKDIRKPYFGDYVRIDKFGKFISSYKEGTSLLERFEILDEFPVDSFLHPFFEIIKDFENARERHKLEEIQKFDNLCKVNKVVFEEDKFTIADKYTFSKDSFYYNEIYVFYKMMPFLTLTYHKKELESCIKHYQIQLDQIEKQLSELECNY